jgi:acetyl-CoA acetyltransferase
MGTGPIPATRRVLTRSGWKIDDVGPIEANEAFAA